MYRDKADQAAASRKHYLANTQKMKDRAAKYTREMRAGLQVYVRELKEATPCMDCGQKFPYCAMDFDHRPGEVKLFDIGTTAKWTSKRALLAEIAKCDLVCACCHRIRTHARMSDT